MYFGKTSKDDPFKYTGSGVYWKKHLKKHGNHIETTIIGNFNDEKLCSEMALKFSKDNDIVKSKLWANLREENGFDGAPLNHPGHIFTQEQKEILSKHSKNMWNNDEFRDKMKRIHKSLWTDERKLLNSNIMKEKWTDERKQKHSQKIKGNPGSKKLKGVPKTKEHNERVSLSLRGKKHSQEHILKLSGPKPRITRILDRKEMSVNHFSRWIKKLSIIS